MTDPKIIDLENHLRRIENSIERWSAAERRIGVERMRKELMQKGLAIDDEMRNATEKFASGELGFEEFFRVFQKKFSQEWRRL